MMTAVSATNQGFIDEPALCPTLQPHDLLVQILGVALNPHDVKAMARLSGTQTARYGFDAVGTVKQVGTAVTNFRPGQIIFYMGNDQRPGSFADYQAVDARLVALAPNLNIDELAGLPLASITAYELLFEKLAFVPAANGNHGQRLLVINGAGGVGSVLTQLASWAGIEVIATSSMQHFPWLLKNNVAFPVDYHTSIEEQVSAPVDASVILSHFEDYLPIVSRLTKATGKIATVVSSKMNLPMGAIFAKSQALLPEMVFSKFLADSPQNNQGQILNFIRQRVNEGELHPITTTTIKGGINAANLTQATAQLKSGHTAGKIVILND